MSPDDLAYMAAVVDMLAVLKVRKMDASDLPVAAITSTRHIEAVRLLCEHTGVKPVSLVKDYVHRGCNEHCPDKHNHVESEGARWQVVGVKATIVLHSLVPYLRVQREAARELVRAGQVIGYKGQVVAEMRRLGWDIPELKAQPRARVATA